MLPGQRDDEDNYTIIKNKKPTLTMGTLDEPEEDPVSLFLKTAQSPDVQTLKRRLIENSR
jgi:hypothetical protein